MHVSAALVLCNCKGSCESCQLVHTKTPPCTQQTTRASHHTTRQAEPNRSAIVSAVAARLPAQPSQKSQVQPVHKPNAFLRMLCDSKSAAHKPTQLSATEVREKVPPLNAHLNPAHTQTQQEPLIKAAPTQAAGCSTTKQRHKLIAPHAVATAHPSVGCNCHSSRGSSISRCFWLYTHHAAEGFGQISHHPHHAASTAAPATATADTASTAAAHAHAPL